MEMNEAMALATPKPAVALPVSGWPKMLYSVKTPSGHVFNSQAEVDDSLVIAEGDEGPWHEHPSLQSHDEYAASQPEPEQVDAQLEP